VAQLSDNPDKPCRQGFDAPADWPHRP
jgi:hypothetical protein